jgi:chromosome segregation protein
VKITRLRLSGFKSFVEPTELLVEPGLTGIVGPNGCGKSNLLEALRWAMGENSAKSMRGTGMEDVIFSGTAVRPARAMAEVTIIADNRERSAPAAFNDSDHLEITRRIERDAGSVYRINGRESRMRDVQLLFADASTGAHSPALVRQGQIGQLIAAKPLQRRAILEEAAGISGLHSRRHEAELRLKAAETNLNRLNDVIGELEQQLAGLKRQARQATRYRNLSGLIRKAEALAFHLRWMQATAILSATESDLRTAETAVAEATERAAAASAAQAEAAAALPALRETEAEKAAAYRRHVREKDALDAEEARAKDQAQRLRQLIVQIGADLTRERERAHDAAETIARLAADIAAIEDGSDARAAAREEASAKAAEIVEALRGAEQALETKTVEAARLAARRQGLERAAADAARKTERLQGLIDTNGAEILRAVEAAKLAPDAALAAAALDAARGDADAKRTAAQDAETYRLTAAADAERAREPLAAADAHAGRLRAEEKALASILKPKDGDLFPPLIDAVRVAPGYEAALAAALGDDLDAPLDEAAPVHWRHLHGEAFASAPLPPGAQGLTAFVDAPPALARRLSMTGLVDDAAGDALQPSLAPGQRLVSRSGALWRWDGFRSHAGAPTPAALRLAQRNRLEALRGEVAEADGAAAEARAAFHAARQAAEAAQEAEREARIVLRSADGAVEAALRALGEAERRAAQLSAQMTGLEQTKARLQSEFDDTARAAAEAAEGLAALTGEAETAAETASLKETVARLRLEASEARAAFEGLKREHEAVDRRRAGLIQDRTGWEKRAEAASLQIGTLAARETATGEELTAAEAVPAAIGEKRGVLLTLIGEAETARKIAADALAEGEAKATDADRAAKATASALTDAREDRARATAALDHARSRFEELVARIREASECAPEELLARAEQEEGDVLPTADDIEAKLEKLRRERESLGGVNLRADEEAQEYEQRLLSMQSEKADLETAIAKLRGAIGSLNREGRERLLGAFETVNGHFKRLFTTLFGGGEAELTLTESDDPLEAGLEILARPPGKKLSTLSLLSGGEQTLTALSLIFAIFLSNPAPICVLDEVDAPLDDANVERFCNLMDEMVRQTETRFLLITHHAYTMARMHRLYGVTMQERGVSQLVSVDLGGAERVLAAE